MAIFVDNLSVFIDNYAHLNNDLAFLTVIFYDLTTVNPGVHVWEPFEVSKKEVGTKRKFKFQ